MLRESFSQRKLMPIIAARVGILKKNKFQDTKQQPPLILCFLEPSKIYKQLFLLIFFNQSIVKMVMNSQFF